VEWLASESARRLAAERGLPGPEHLQRWFTERLRDWLAARDRRLVGWDEIMDEGPLAGSVVMAWRDVRYGIQAAAAGMDVVMSPTSHTYFDYYPSDLSDEPYAIGGHLPVEQVYAFEPLAGLPPQAHPRVLGTQCQLWTEYLPSARRVDYMMFPRACAHSEVAWSDPTERSWSEFAPRLEAHLDRLDALGVGFRPLDGPRPWQRGGTGPLARPRPLKEPLAAFQHVEEPDAPLGAPYHGLGAGEALPPQRS
jgi:hexosaminidase